jgi:DUF917 family protein
VEGLQDGLASFWALAERRFGRNASMIASLGGSVVMTGIACGLRHGRSSASTMASGRVHPRVRMTAMMTADVERVLSEMSSVSEEDMHAMLKDED